MTFELATLPRFFASLTRIASRNLFVPSGMKRPGPGFAHCSANHRLKCARLADRAQVDVNEDPAQHDDGGNIVQNIAHRDGPTPECARSSPKNNSSDEINDRATNDLPELHFLPCIEKAGFRRILFLLATSD